MSTTQNLTTNNPSLQSVWKFLTPEAKAEICRLEEVSKSVEDLLMPLEDGAIRPLAHLANLYLGYSSVIAGDVDDQLAVNISLLHLELSRLEAMVITPYVSNKIKA